MLNVDVNHGIIKKFPAGEKRKRKIRIWSGIVTIAAAVQRDFFSSPARRNMVSFSQIDLDKLQNGW